MAYKCTGVYTGSMSAETVVVRFVIRGIMCLYWLEGTTTMISRELAGLPLRWRTSSFDLKERKENSGLLSEGGSTRLQHSAWKEIVAFTTIDIFHVYQMIFPTKLHHGRVFEATLTSQVLQNLWDATQVGMTQTWLKRNKEQSSPRGKFPRTT